MITLYTVPEVRQFVQAAKQYGRTIGLVPTMGYLHEGHMTLVEASRQQNDITMASIFVNPLQFGPNEDFERYPRDLRRDVEMLARHGCDVVFAPSAAEMYPRPSATFVEVAELGERLEGASRPGHFRGMTTVVSKLFHIVTPDAAYFGQKDGQQVILVRRMVSDLHMAVEIVTVPTVREPNGLALSSRNIYLSPQERHHAAVLYRALEWASAQVENGGRSGASLADGMRQMIAREPLVQLVYAEVVSADTLETMDKLSGRTMFAVAAHVGLARLIDNIVLDV